MKRSAAAEARVDAYRAVKYRRVARPGPEATPVFEYPVFPTVPEAVLTVPGRAPQQQHSLVVTDFALGPDATTADVVYRLLAPERSARSISLVLQRLAAQSPAGAWAAIRVLTLLEHQSVFVALADDECRARATLKTRLASVADSLRVAKLPKTFRATTAGERIWLGPATGEGADEDMR
jgi:hypothetical protein